MTTPAIRIQWDTAHQYAGPLRKKIPSMLQTKGMKQHIAKGVPSHSNAKEALPVKGLLRTRESMPTEASRINTGMLMEGNVAKVERGGERSENEINAGSALPEYIVPHAFTSDGIRNLLAAEAPKPHPSIPDAMIPGLEARRHGEAIHHYLSMHGEEKIQHHLPHFPADFDHPSDRIRLGIERFGEATDEIAEQSGAKLFEQGEFVAAMKDRANPGDPPWMAITDMNYIPGNSAPLKNDAALGLSDLHLHSHRFYKEYLPDPEATTLPKIGWHAFLELLMGKTSKLKALFLSSTYPSGADYRFAYIHEMLHAVNPFFNKPKTYVMRHGNRYFRFGHKGGFDYDEIVISPESAVRATRGMPARERW